MPKKRTKKADTNPPASKMLEGFFIDPYKQEFYRIEIAKDTDVWRKALRCEWLEVVCLSRGSIPDCPPLNLDLWIDEEGLLKTVPAPRFKLSRGGTAGGGEVQIAGYGLVFSSDSEGETISLRSDWASANLFVHLCGLQYEVIEGNPRFGKDAENLFVEEKLRVVEFELPGQFRILTADE